MSEGSRILSSLLRSALSTYTGKGPVLDDTATATLAGSLAAVTATAELLGRAGVREAAGRALTPSAFRQSGGTLSQFADLPPGAVSSPEEALAYFTRLVPTLGVDPERFPGEQRRRAFTLAESTNQVLTERVQRAITEGLGESRSAADTVAVIRQAFEESGVSPRNPQYADMVFRTNAADSYQTGVYEEGRHPDVADLFPVWQYQIIDDHRTGDDHRPKGGRYYPADATFADVRGNRPFNCRCSLRWVDFSEWDDLRSRGARVESEW